MATKIFMNYRRDDSASATGRLYDRLEPEFGEKQLFIDIDHIKAGADFIETLNQQVAQCDVLISMIGPQWLQATNSKTGQRRLDNPDDFVRIEIEAALKLDITIIPVLVENADMPGEDDLPDSLKPLARRNAVRLTHERFRADSRGLVSALKAALEEAEAKRQAALKTQEGEQHQAVERTKKQAEEEKQSQKNQAKLDALAGLSHGEINTAMELANWNFISSSPSEGLLRDHLARFLEGGTTQMALVSLERLIWQSLGNEANKEALQSFLAEFPEGEHATDAKNKIAAMLHQEQQELTAEQQRQRGTSRQANEKARETAAATEEQAKHQAKQEKRRQQAERTTRNTHTCAAASADERHFILIAALTSVAAVVAIVVATVRIGLVLFPHTGPLF